MKLFTCQNCGQLVYFENVRCERCSFPLGYLARTATLSALEPEGKTWRALASPGKVWRFCANAEHGACNWLVPNDMPDAYCAACRHNRTIPQLSVPGNEVAWRKLEHAKHRLFYSLLQLRLPLVTRAEDREYGLAFDFLADPTNADDHARVVTGHDNGLITLAVAEADDTERERRRVGMGEPYRTLLGHLRHEVGHYYWGRLVRDGQRIEACRAVFGNDEKDYGQALRVHYDQGAPADWQDRFISAYASSHPWEDFAETWAHYLHIVDTLEMARAFGLSLGPEVAKHSGLAARIDFDPYAAVGIGRIIAAWLPLTSALNNLNRCMGEPDLYPFVLSPTVINKLGFVHDLIQAQRC
jgi:hypothetical protein